MEKYLCKNKTNCSNADDFVEFSLADPGKPVCPVCGSGNLRKASGSAMPGNSGGVGGASPKKALLIGLAALASVAVAGGSWYAWHGNGGGDAPPAAAAAPAGGTASAQASGPDTPQALAAADPQPSAEPVAPPPTQPEAPPVQAQQTTPDPPPPPVEPAEPPAQAQQTLPDPAPPTQAQQTPPAHPELFGVIEIGGKGVKGVVVDLGKSETDPQCQTDEEVFANCLIRQKLESRNVNPIEAGAVEEAAKAANDMHDDMVNKYTVDPTQIYVVGSSSVAEVSHHERLKQTIEDRLGKPGLMGFVTASEEAGYGFQGVMHLLPPAFRERRKREAMVLDIGSGNTKGAYMEVMGNEKRLIDFAIPWGTKKFSNHINAERGDASFKDTAARLRNSLLRPLIRDEMARKQGIAMHGRVYLLGGIPWALVNLVQPDNKQHFPKVFPEHIETLYNEAIRPNARRRMCDENPHKTDEISRVCQTFDVENIIAGLDMLKTFSEEIKFKEKAVFFMRDSLYAWPLGYLKTRCAAEGKC